MIRTRLSGPARAGLAVLGLGLVFLVGLGASSLFGGDPVKGPERAPAEIQEVADAAPVAEEPEPEEDASSRQRREVLERMPAERRASREKALAEGDWDRARGSGIEKIDLSPHVHRMLGDLEKLLSTPARTPEEEVRRAYDIGNLEMLLAGVRPASLRLRVMERVAEMVVQADSEESAARLAAVLRRGLSSGPDAPEGESALSVLRPIVDAELHKIEKKHPARVQLLEILAGCSTLEATRLVLEGTSDASRNGTLVRAIRDPASAEALGKAFRGARSFESAEHLAVALKQCGVPGRAELLRTLRGAAEVPPERAYVLGYAIAGVLQSVQAVEDLAAVHDATRSVEALQAVAVSHVPGIPDRPSAALAIVRYLDGDYGAPLRAPLAARLAAMTWTEEVEEAVGRLRAEARAEVEKLRNR